MKLTYKYKLKLSEKSKKNIDECLHLCRLYYNSCIEERIFRYEKIKYLRKTEDWKNAMSSLPNYYSQKKELPIIKKSDERFKKYPSNIFQNVAERVNRSYQNFFRGAGYPEFKSRKKYNSFTMSYANGYFMDGFGSTKLMSKQLNENYYPVKPFLKISGIGILKILGYRKYKIRGIIKTVTIETDRNRKDFWVCFSCDNVADGIGDKTGNVVGIDVGVENYATLSDGTKIDNPDIGKEFERKIRVIQRSISRKTKYSSRWILEVKKLSNIQKKMAMKRKYFQHKLSKLLVEKYDVIVMEKLNLKNMTKSASGTIEEPGKNVAQKSGLNRVMLDGAFYQFRLMIEYKCKKYGKKLILVDPKNTSITCNKCGHKDKENRLSQSEFRCRLCGHSDHADVNAAKNIIDKGLSMELDVKTG